jgi:hypothetical protein
MTKPKPGAIPGRPPDGEERKVTLALRVPAEVKAYLLSTGNASKAVERLVGGILKRKGQGRLTSCRIHPR